MSELIFHHYDFSPFAEKIRLIFGLKSLHWRSVIVPSVMPKPDLVALTGGYRHVPVLQIGADIFCDTRLIARELDSRFPHVPLVQPNLDGLALAVEAWAERDLFWPIARYVSGTNGEAVGPALHVDRAALHGKHAPSMARLKTFAESNFALVQAQIPRVEDMLGGNHPYLLSDRLCRADLAVYHALWFLSAMPIDCSDVLRTYPRITSWMQRIESIGHGTSDFLPSRAALEIAGQASPAPLRSSVAAAFDPAPGTRVALRPEGYVTADVVGDLVFLDQDEIALHRADPLLGDIIVHFPRIGYAMKGV